jgi:hypothetical protein
MRLPVRCLLYLLLLFSPDLPARVIKTPPVPSPPSLLQLTQKAGYIFSGTVLTVERVPTKTQNEVATIRITFRVNQAVRGVSTQQVLTIREWAGLWEAGDRYRPGEQVLLFLYRPSKVGLTSPVSGDLGRFKLNIHGKTLLDAQRLAGLPIAVPSAPDPIAKGRVAIRSLDLVRAIRKVGD